MTLNEENFDSVINDLFAIHNDWVEVFKELEKKADQVNEYSIVANSLIPIFIYSLIKNKCDLEQFSNVMSHFYKSYSVGNLGSELNDFFYRRDRNISLADYVKLDKYNNDVNIWDNISYLFLDLDVEKSVGKRLLLDKDNLPYLLAMLNEVTDDTVGTLWYAGYHRFVCNFVTNIEQIKPLIDMAENNSAFTKNKVGEYSGFFNKLIQEAGTLSYEKEMYPNMNTDIYKSLVKYVPNIDDKISKALFSKTQSRDQNMPQMDLGVLNFCLTVGSETNVIEKINTKYKEVYEEFKSKDQKNKLQNARHYGEIASEFKASIDVSFREHHFDLDCSKVDTSKEFRDNFVYLKLIDIKIRKKENFKMDKDVAKYFIDLLENEDQNDLANQIYGIKTLFRAEKIIPFLKKYVNYRELDEQLEQKAVSKGKKSKV